MTASIWFDGEWRDDDVPHVFHDDSGLTVGDGVFETILVRRSAPFAVSRHLHRLSESAARVGISLPPRDQLRAAIERIAATSNDSGFVRVTITSGRGPLGSPRGEGACTAIVARRAGSTRQEPTAVSIARGTRNEHSLIAGVKSTSYVENVVALAEATAQGATEALFLNNAGLVCEGTGSNIFVALDGSLVTPTIASGCLAGITRALLLEAGVGVERDFDLDALGRCSEAFLVSTGREVQPITRIGDLVFDAAPGPLTVQARTTWVNDIEPLDDP